MLYLGSCGATKLNKLQNLNNRAAKIVTHSPFDSSLIQDLEWPAIEELIHRETSVVEYTYLNKLAPDYLSSCISKLSDRHTRELQNSAIDLLIPRMKTSYGKNPVLFAEQKSEAVLL